GLPARAARHPATFRAYPAARSPRSPDNRAPAPRSRRSRSSPSPRRALRALPYDRPSARRQPHGSGGHRQLGRNRRCPSVWQPPAVGGIAYLQRMGQLSFADVDPLADVSLRDTTFVVVDLETTGGRPTGEGCDEITEIGAVKVRGG